MASTSARPFVLLALCVLLQAFISAQSSGSTFHVIGRVYCDTCRCGFETPATNYIQGTNIYKSHFEYGRVQVRVMVMHGWKFCQLKKESFIVTCHFNLTCFSFLRMVV